MSFHWIQQTLTLSLMMSSHLSHIISYLHEDIFSSDEWLGHPVQKYKDKELKEQDLLKISQAMNQGDIFGIGLEFGLTHNSVDLIKNEHVVQDQCYQLLIKWNRKMGKAATLDKLVQHLFHAWESQNRSVDVNELRTALSKIEQ